MAAVSANKRILPTAASVGDGSITIDLEQEAQNLALFRAGDKEGRLSGAFQKRMGERNSALQPAIENGVSHL